MGTELSTKVAGAVKKAGFGLKKHSPEILVITGVVGVVASAVIACRQTLKLPEVLEDHKDAMDKIHECGGELTEKEVQKLTVKEYAHTSLDILELYGPAVSLGVASLGCIFASNSILRKRNVALAAAYTAVDKGFKEYRNRVIERFGEEVDHQLRYNLQPAEVEETVTDEKGKEKKVKKSVLASDGEASGYAKYFTRGNNEWINDPSFVKDYFSMKQRFFNDKLKADGHLTLNDVYRELGFHDSKAGMVVGWIYDPKCPTGDNYVELTVKEVWLPNEYDGTLERGYLVDFNVDGNIYDKMI